MKGFKMKHWWLLVAFAVSSTVSAAVLKPESGLSVLYINGVETESSIGEQYLESGSVDLIVRMDTKVGRSNSGSNVFTSAPYVVSFTVTADEVKMQLPQARSMQEAEEAFRDDKPAWSIVQNGKETEFTQEILPGKEGLFPYLGLSKIVAGYYGSKNNSVIKQQAIVADSTDGQGSKTASNLTQLKAWYLKSSTEERKAFRRWMIDQE